MNKSAIFDDDRKYRYLLTRVWDEQKPKAMCIGLNPSTANEENNDRTIGKLINILSNAGYGGFYMTNLFALISPYPDDLRKYPDPVRDNDKWIQYARQECNDVIFCWGAFKQATYRAKRICEVFGTTALCFGKNANGSPKHPLFLKSTITLQPWPTRK